MRNVTKVLISLILLKSAIAFLDETVIFDFSKAKNLTFGAVFTCNTKKESLRLFRYLNDKNLHFSFVNLQKTSNLNILNRKHNLAVVLDFDCGTKFNELPQKVPFLSFLKLPLIDEFQLNQTYFFETFHWLIFTEFQESLKKLQNISFNINSDVNLAVYEGKWTIFDVYNPAFDHGGQIVITKLDYYNKQHFRGNKYWIRKNMTGVHFKSAIVTPKNTSLKAYLSSDTNRQVNSMHRFQAVTINHCRDLYNFSLHIQATNSWGYKQSNGHFDGLVGLLECKQIDFGSSPLIYKLDRMPVIDYSYGNWILRSTFIFRRPKIVQNSFEIFLRPLATKVWICIVALMLLMIICLKLAFKHEGLKLRADSSWSFVCLFTIASFCQQGSGFYPMCCSSRTVAFVVFLFCILIYDFYSCSIVSHLLMEPRRVINNLQDLCDSDLKAGIEDILIDRNYFVQTTDPVAIALFNKKIRGATSNSGFYLPQDGIERVKFGGFAFHIETSTAYPLIENTFTNEEICDLQEVQMYRTQPMYTNLQKNSPFREMMNFCMVKMVENGLMDGLRKYWDARKPTCIQQAKNKEIHMGLAEFSCGLIVLGYGIFLSLALFIFEVAINWRTSKQEKVYPFIH